MEIVQWLFMLGTLLTVMVNTASVVRLTRRIDELEDEVWEFKGKYRGVRV